MRRGSQIGKTDQDDTLGFNADDAWEVLKRTLDLEKCFLGDLPPEVLASAEHHNFLIYVWINRVTITLMNRPSIWDYLPQPEKDCVPPQEREDRQVYAGYWLFYNRDGSVSFGTEEREYFGRLPAEITRAVPESVVNYIASIVFQAHRTGRKEAYTYLKDFVLDKLEIPDSPYTPMPKLPRSTPPPLPPQDAA